ncbi:hypothetical protein NADFUDRAFT_47519 [Nadsonia fulvescens var. elongata DSM 6958]|uniref:Uncharacterized protein n=1 Tax=Nadsonia fulvescens var. elongata DSM 6958 TaxID=857566 RepID=A0A1E3PH59_9ASCO|nr:hypothetical protein NADFUDRAFT_47519 [Nadsonia fulvescens var. elongata DSM 6958]
MLAGIVNYSSGSDSDSGESSVRPTLTVTLPPPNPSRPTTKRVRIVVGKSLDEPSEPLEKNNDVNDCDSNTTKKAKLSIASFLPPPTRRKEVANKGLVPGNSEAKDRLNTPKPSTAKQVTSFIPASVRDRMRATNSQSIPVKQDIPPQLSSPTFTNEAPSILSNLFNITTPSQDTSAIKKSERYESPIVPEIHPTITPTRTLLDVGPAMDASYGDGNSDDENPHGTTAIADATINPLDIRGFLPRSHKPNVAASNNRLSKDRMVEFSVDSFYEENQRLKALGQLESTKCPIQAVRGSKHNLQALINKAKDNKEGYEEMFSKEKSKRGGVGEGGSAIYHG